MADPNEIVGNLAVIVSAIISFINLFKKKKQ